MSCYTDVCTCAHMIYEHLTVPKKKQFTVAVIKPDAVKAGQVDEIIGKVTNQNC